MSWQQPGLFMDFNETPLANNSIGYTHSWNWKPCMTEMASWDCLPYYLEMFLGSASYILGSFHCTVSPLLLKCPSVLAVSPHILPLNPIIPFPSSNDLLITATTHPLLPAHLYNPFLPLGRSMCCPWTFLLYLTSGFMPLCLYLSRSMDYILI